MSTQPIIEVLKSISIFQNLAPADLTVWASGFEIRSFAPLTQTIKEDEVSHDFFIVRSGTVNVTRNGREKEVFLATLGPGDYFGEASMFHPELKRTAHVKAQEKVELLVITREKFLKYLRTNPVGANQILVQMLKQVFMRLVQTSHELSFRRDQGMAQDEIDKLFALGGV
jgi:CRP-like cAMP-binding protein